MCDNVIRNVLLLRALITALVMFSGLERKLTTPLLVTRARGLVYFPGLDTLYNGPRPRSLCEFTLLDVQLLRASIFPCRRCRARLARVTLSWMGQMKTL